MEKIYVVFWTQGGNTQAMAEAVAEGIREGGKEAEVTYVGAVQPDDLKSQDVFALGCPAMGAEVLEEGEMEPFVETMLMRDWEERMKQAGATVVGGEGVICHETPDEDGLADCRALGKQLASA
mgnify:CR=1 FL=1